MLQIRVTPTRALARRPDVLSATIIPLVHQRNFAIPRKKLSLSSTGKNMARLAAIKSVRKAFGSAVPSVEFKAAKNDAQRRDLLWSKRAQIETAMPTKSFESVYGIGRRLWEKGILFELPPGKELKDVLFAEQGTVLSQIESEPPLWLQSEIKEMQLKDVEKEKESEEKLANPLVDEEEIEVVKVTETAKIAETTPPQTSIQPNAINDSTDTTSAEEDHLLSDEASADDELFQYPIITPRASLPDTTKNDHTDAGTAEKDPIAEAELIEIPASIRKQMEEKYILEDIAMRIMKQMTVDEPPEVAEKMEKLKDLSKVLREEDTRPDMKPVSYPSQAAYAVLSEATGILEEAAFNYVSRTMPTVVTWPSFDSPEAQEYKKWISLINRLSRHLSHPNKASHKLPPKFLEWSTYGDVIRNAAAHRIQINAPKMNKLLAHAKQWIDLLEVPETAAKFERLQESAAKMQGEMEEALKPVSEEVMGSLDKIKRRWGAVKKLEQQILDIKQKITQEKSVILKEEDGIKEILKKGQAIRIARGKAFSRDEMRKYVHVAPISVEETPEPAPGTKSESTVNVEPVVETIVERAETIVEPAAETVEPEAKTTVETPTDNAKDAIKLPEAAKEDVQEEPKMRTYAGASKKKTTIELSAKDIKEMLDIENASFTEADRKHLSRDRIGGLVSFSKKTLANIPEPGSTETPQEGISWERPPEKKSTSETRTPEPETPKTNFEGSNLSKDADLETMKKSGPTWYNPLSWFG
ncbi:hypothetical protein Dda_1479 [Drechslerella dactyloides]|uniref:Uncharacterized protein n=1 Tax=Drechslerella dactyloides TaxID=74499 RepID=A0AAD6J686_DREDA|nr:hypothetical protein Dda_1479 [Drechslerella dactyloides]